MDFYSYVSAVQKGVETQDSEGLASLGIQNNMTIVSNAYKMYLKTKLAETGNFVQHSELDYEGADRFLYTGGTVVASVHRFNEFERVSTEHSLEENRSALERIKALPGYIHLGVEQGLVVGGEHKQPGFRADEPENVTVGKSLLDIIGFLRLDDVETCFLHEPFFNYFPKGHEMMIWYHPEKDKK